MLKARRHLFGWVLLGLGAAGCSHGLQEVGFAIPDATDRVHHIVTRDVASSRWSVNQPHTAGVFHCKQKRTSEEMAELRRDGNEHTWYVGCVPVQDMPQHKYVLASDQSIASLVQGPVSAAMISAGVAFAGHQIGRGLKGSGDSVTQNGGGAHAEGGDAVSKSGSDNVSIKTTNIGKKTTNINSNNTITTK